MSKLELDWKECQAESFNGGASKMSPIRSLARRTREHVRQYGVTQTFSKVADFVLHGRRDRALLTGSCARRKSPADVSLDLQPGELVEVKSEEEIRTTLDENGRLNGLGFMPIMRRFCGKRFIVFKRMETLFDEYTHEIHKPKNTVLLSGVHCDGLLYRCDRACFLFWREAWLKRVSPDNTESSSETVRSDVLTKPGVEAHT